MSTQTELTAGHTPGPWQTCPFDIAHCRVTPADNLFFSIASVSGFNEQEAKANAELIAAAPALLAENARLRGALEAVLLFHSNSPWTDGKKTEWWNLTQSNEATTRTLCDTARLALGKLPSCFGDFTGRKPSDLPADMPLTHEQRNALTTLEPSKYPAII